jgi:hypothetical protein
MEGVAGTTGVAGATDETVAVGAADVAAGAELSAPPALAAVFAAGGLAAHAMTVMDSGIVMARILTMVLSLEVAVEQPLAAHRRRLPDWVCAAAGAIARGSQLM